MFEQNKTTQKTIEIFHKMQISHTKTLNLNRRKINYPNYLCALLIPKFKPDPNATQHRMLDEGKRCEYDKRMTKGLNLPIFVEYKFRQCSMFVNSILCRLI